MRRRGKESIVIRLLRSFRYVISRWVLTKFYFLKGKIQERKHSETEKKLLISFGDSFI